MKLIKLLLIVSLIAFLIWSQIECIEFGYDGAVIGTQIYCIRSTKFETYSLYLIDPILKLKKYESEYIKPTPEPEQINESSL